MRLWMLLLCVVRVTAVSGPFLLKVAAQICSQGSALQLHASPIYSCQIILFLAQSSPQPTTGDFGDIISPLPLYPDSVCVNGASCPPRLCI